MFFNTFKSEWTKLTTTKGIWWNLFFYFLLVVGFLLPNIYDLKSRNRDFTSQGLPAMPLDPGVINSMAAQGGGLILMILAILVVTTEYGHKYAPMTFQAVPRRWNVAIAKLLLMSLIAIVLTVISIGIALVMYRFIAGADALNGLNFDNKDFVRMLWIGPFYTVMLVLLAQGVAWLVRNSAGSIVIMLVWYMVLEVMVIPMIPKLGEKIHPYGPLSNLGAFFHNQDLANTPWDVTGSLIYFLAWAVGIYAVGLVLLYRRDA
ncbi:hypothetical protein QVA66_07165 [Staphylococcus chromogenes]|nr:hypothetical protein [Staphylococcus chromogenes]